jgi:WD40 repeat protein/mono/diheme cytochrome c family protein
MKTLAFRWSLATLSVLGLLHLPLQADEPRPPATGEQVKAVLQTHCHRCHGQEGASEGGFNFILDLDKLVARKKVAPGNAMESPLFKRVAAGKMPPPEIEHRPTAEEIALLRRWIDAGAPRPAVAERTLVGESGLYDTMLADLESLDRRARRFQRYFSFAPQYNAGASPDEMETHRHALSKLINSLSWHYRITPPIAIGTRSVPATLLRIDLRDFQWDATLWNRILAEYPYGLIQETAVAKAVHVATGTRMPLVRGDWFLATASRAPLYHDILQLPTTAAELERQLRVDAAVNIQQERVARAGFNGSGISKQNRLLERHDALHGAYWRSYDFDPIPQNLLERELQLPDRRNLFAYPLGPGFTENTFRHAGGEIIFNLPNGLQAYMLVNADGLRIDRGPLQIVSDPKRPDRAVETGLSCIGCHVQGIQLKDDQIRDHVTKNPKLFSRADADLVQALYVPATKMRKLMDDDTERFRKAVENTGARLTRTEPIITNVLRYEADLDLETAASELGLRPRDLVERVQHSEVLAKNLGAFKLADGTVQRQVFIQTFPENARELRLGTPFQPLLNGVVSADLAIDLDPLEGPSGQTNAATFSPDGKLILLASADKSVRVRERERNVELRRLVGHTASVWCVVFSPDGKSALSGGADGTVRLWDIETGRELRVFAGHTSLVSAVACSSDGRRALSASYDRSVVLWDLETGQELRRFESLPDYINALAFTGDGKGALLALGRSVSLLDLATGQTLRRFTGATGSMVCLASSPGGRWIAGGSDDCIVRLWDPESGQEILRLNGHEGPVRSVAVSADGQRVASGSADRTVSVWEARSGRLLKRFGPLPDSIVSVAFTGETGVLAALRDGSIRSWGVAVASRADEVIVVPTAEYLRPTKDGFARECEFYQNSSKAGSDIKSITFRGATKLQVQASYAPDGALTTADVTLDDGKKPRQVVVEVAGSKASVRRDGQPTQEFTVPKGVIVTSAPDWTDTFVLCRKFDRKGPAKQEFPGLWVHPTQPAQLLTFSIERLGADTLEHLGKKQEVDCCLIRIRGNSPYVAWMDQHQKMLKLVPLPYREGAMNELVHKGYEKSARTLVPPQAVRNASAKP